MKNQLKKGGWEFTKIHKIDEQIGIIEKIINEIEKDIAIELASLPIYTRFLKNINGVGVWIAGSIISQIGYVERFHSISALRKYSGWYPSEGKAVRRKSGEQAHFSTKMHQTCYDFVEGIMRGKDGIYYNDFLRYRKAIYEKHPEYLDRKATKKLKIEGIPSHTMRQAKRKVIQKFLTDLFCIWRDLEGLPQTTPLCNRDFGSRGIYRPAQRE